MLWPAMLKRRTGSHTRWGASAFLVLSILLQLFVPGANAGFVAFDNCLSSSIVDSNPKQLQFVPLYFNARFDTNDPNRRLNITIYGNVTGQAVEGPYPPPDDPQWSNPNETFGKIVDISPTNNRYSTLFERYQFLNYDAYEAPPSQFCIATINSSCPLGPSFNGNNSDPYTLSAFTVAHNLNTSYSFATILATIRIRSGDAGAQDLACISASITPDLGQQISGLLRYLPVVVLIFVGLATMAAAIFSPWGTSDPFKWTTNYGRDEDLLRLVTPGFGDCLQYIQFVFLTGALSLNYPGYYQPAVSQVSWSSLQFNESFVTKGPGYASLMDGLYSTNATRGMTRMSQLIGMSSRTDIWACMAIWLAVLILVAIAFCQSAFLLRWIYFKLSDTTEEDLRHKNWPLTGGMLVRVVYNYFLLPIVAISMFQLLIAPESRFYMVIAAVVVLFFIIVLAGWILYIIYYTKPRALLFDDLPILLLYGSLYNTYSDERAPFALIPVILTFVRGVAIGAIQATGIAQIITLAICEVVFILTLHAFRPFSSPTHMNLMHTIYAVIRLVTIFLMIAFVPSLGVIESSRGWVGYIILLLHAIVLVFGFFLNSIQTLIEVGARMAGAGGDSQHGARRGALISYSWRQLRSRKPNKGIRPTSTTSDAAMLANDQEAKHYNPSNRTRSLSASSRMLLANQRYSGNDLSSLGDIASSPGPDTPTGSTHLPSAMSGAIAAAGTSQVRRMSQTQADPYYRPPRARRATLDPGTPATKGRTSESGDWGTRSRGYDDWPDEDDAREGDDRNSPSPAFFRHQRAGSDTDLGEQQGNRTDYAVREVDFYYGVTRGPALSSQPTRKRKTGPADPMGPVSNASTWLQRLIGGKKKDNQKGFEVVRSSRAPPDMLNPINTDRGPDQEGEELQTSPPIHYPPYRDSPDGQAAAGAVHSRPDNVPEASKTTRRMPLDGSWDESTDDENNTPRPGSSKATSSKGDKDNPPFLRPIARSPSLKFTFPDNGIASQQTTAVASPVPRSPPVPRRSSRRNSSLGGSIGGSGPSSPGFPPVSFGGGGYSQDRQAWQSDRPASMGLVNHKVTGSSVTAGSGIVEGSRAEIVDEGGVRQGSRQVSRERRLDLE
ncbi:Transient receptor potential (TRP) ion channel-like protein 2 [Elsinoe fawcettii]|nr:Transient receptor potential (TRP) ion channel-like protein 2 [Elsinoe fawcettii]